jgi:hypothetical protein
MKQAPDPVCVPPNSSHDDLNQSRSPAGVPPLDEELVLLELSWLDALLALEPSPPPALVSPEPLLDA